tara:strand:+ start:2492 stop:2878 length:387 start_codon:yes stop_codon:yes gene_type:complete
MNEDTLNDLIDTTDNILEKEVAEQIMYLYTQFASNDENERQEDVFKLVKESLTIENLENGGLLTLVYKREIKDHFDKFYIEIEKIRKNYHVYSSLPLTPPADKDLRSYLVWFAIEEMADDIFSKLMVA